MSLKKSEISSTPGPRIRPPWVESLRANLPIPILLLLLIPASLYIESREFDPYYRRVMMLAGFNIILAVSLQLINGFSGQFSLGHAGFMAVGAYLAAYPAMNLSNRFDDPAACLLFFVSLDVVVGIVGGILLGVFVLLRATRKIYAPLPALLLVALLAWLLMDLSKASDIKGGAPLPMYLVWSKAIDLVQQLFLWMTTSGLPVASRISEWLPGGIRAPLSYLVLVIGGGACAGVVGLIVGMPTLRLRGDYLAIATLGLAEIIRIVIQNAQPLGGALGLTGIPKFTNFVWLFGGVVVTVAIIWRLAYSAKGRAIMAVREDEIAAAATGIDPTHHKVMAFIIGAFFGGVAGAMFSLHERSITPSYFNIAKSIEIVVMVTLGGLGSISGAILAAIVLTVLPELLRNISPEIADYRMIIYSLLLIAMMLLRPQGLLGGRELWPKRRGPQREATAAEDRDDRESAREAPVA